MINHTDVQGRGSFLIGIDDTDNSNSRGTGYLSRSLAHELIASRKVQVDSITRHQLYVHPAIRYTSQNSSSCIRIQARDIYSLVPVIEEFLLKNSADGSDAGLCISPEHLVDPSIITWGNEAKITVLKLEEARFIADSSGVYLKGFTGNYEGMIGALAAVGLRAGGNDGRFIWRKRQKELRDIKEGVMNVSELMQDLDLKAIRSLEGEVPAPDERILVNDWVRPILENHQAILIADKTENDHKYEWTITPKEIVRSIS
jgi:hypothetical protein